MKNIQPKKFKIFVNSGLGMSLLMFNLRFCKYKDSFIIPIETVLRLLKRLRLFFFLTFEPLNPFMVKFLVIVTDMKN